MNICGMEKMSLVDYDGKICATLFCPGCNFACPFCHNGGIVQNALPLLKTQDIFEFLSKRKKMLDAITVSGGEPTLQKDLLSFLSQLKDMGFSVKLDTNGSNFDVLKTAVKNKLVDYVAMDVKNSLQNYPKTIGKTSFDRQAILDSVDFLKTNAVDYEFRTTLVKELHDEQSVIDMSTWLNGAKKLFLQKFKPSQNCLRQGLSPIDKQTATEFLQIFKQTIQRVSLRGYD